MQENFPVRQPERKPLVEQKLTPTELKAFTLDLQDKTTEEIAEELGISTMEAEKLIESGRKKFHEHMKEQFKKAA